MSLNRPADPRSSREMREDRESYIRSLVERDNANLALRQRREEQLVHISKEIAKFKDQRIRDYMPPRVSDVSGGYEKIDDSEKRLIMASKAYASNLAQERESVANQVYILNEAYRRWRANRKRLFIDMVKDIEKGAGKGVGRGPGVRIRIGPDGQPTGEVEIE